MNQVVAIDSLYRRAWSRDTHVQDTGHCPRPSSRRIWSVISSTDLPQPTIEITECKGTISEETRNILGVEF
jgi:hypothetical protein